MNFSAVIAPQGEPIGLAEARLHLKADSTADDALITAGVAAVRAYAEQETSQQLVAGRFLLTLDAFPADATPIQILRVPVLDLVSVQYTDSAGVLTTLVEDTDYHVDLAGQPARIAPAPGGSWPSTETGRLAAVRFTFTAGHAAPMTADATADTVTLRGWPALAVDAALRFSNSGGGLPAPLVADTDYYVRTAPGGGVYTVSATLGGPLLDLTTAGTGVHFVGAVPEGLKSWMKLRLGTLDTARQDVTAGVSLTPLPFADRLLDPFIVYARP
jgi:uncharacterized phiE125 gp8 family phage protein